MNRRQCPCGAWFTAYHGNMRTARRHARSARSGGEPGVGAVSCFRYASAITAPRRSCRRSRISVSAVPRTSSLGAGLRSGFSTTTLCIGRFGNGGSRSLLRAGCCAQDRTGAGSRSFLVSVGTSATFLVALELLSTPGVTGRRAVRAPAWGGSGERPALSEVRTVSSRRGVLAGSEQSVRVQVDVSRV
jgi:hypothetical protein